MRRGFTPQVERSSRVAQSPLQARDVSWQGQLRGQWGVECSTSVYSLMVTPMLTAAQCRAARALVELSCAQLANAAQIDEHMIRQFEKKFHEPDDATKQRLRLALEAAGAVFIPEQDGAGEGVRLKFSRPGIRAVQRWEGEGGSTGEDDV
jgi:DNA-binding transcriptional regulator YiaG